MSWLNKTLRVAALAAALATAQTAVAGRSCEEAQAAPAALATAFDTASHLAQVLESSGQKVAVIARRGQNLDKFGLSFSHAAFAVKESSGWVVYHDLNICGSAVSKLFTQGLADFFADDLVSQDAAVIVPEPWLQDRLVQLLSSKDELFRMHQSAYSAVAYPFSTKYQNSNGWVLETYARAASDVVLPGREEAQAWLKVAGYKPNILEIGPMTRLGGRMFKANVAFDDHPPELRWNNKITVNTADGLLQFIGRNGMKQSNCLHGKFTETVCIVSPD